MDEYRIILDNISKAFKNTTVLTDVNIKFEKNKIYGIVGRNGSGKSVLLKTIAGLVTPSSGTVTVNGEVLKKGHYAKSTGIVLDCIGFLPSCSARENLRSLADINKTVTYSEVDEIILQAGLDPESEQQYRKFSLGMKQKLAIAQAFMEKPTVLLLDEPMNALDEESVEGMRKFFLSYVRENEATMLLTSHNSEDINTLCDEKLFLKNGKLSKS